MPSLWEIDQKILACCDAETGEIIDCEALDSLVMQRNEKVEAVALWVKNLLSDAEAIKAEKDALADREAKCRKKAEDLKKWLGFALEGQRFSTARCAVSFRRSETVEVSDIALLPECLKRVKTEVEPNKTAIKALLKNGQEVVGCCLVENFNTQIK